MRKLTKDVGKLYIGELTNDVGKLTKDVGKLTDDIGELT